MRPSNTSIPSPRLEALALRLTAGLARVLPRRSKATFEWLYWRLQKWREGDLANDHYRMAFTDLFGLDDAFYRGQRVLDVGCGPRGSLEWMDAAAERVGLDPLADRYLKLGADRHAMRYVAGPAEAMPLPDAYFDVVTAFNALDHVDDVAATAREIARVTRPGGAFLLITDVGHRPTPMEPQTFSWDVLDRFRPAFEVNREAHYERGPKMYQSIAAGHRYDHADPSERYGILLAHLVRR